VKQKGVVSVEVGISPLVATDSSLVTGDMSSISEEDIGTETLGGVGGIYSSEGSQMGF